MRTNKLVLAITGMLSTAPACSHGVSQGASHIKPAAVLTEAAPIAADTLQLTPRQLIINNQVKEAAAWCLEHNPDFSSRKKCAEGVISTLGINRPGSIW